MTIVEISVAVLVMSVAVMGVLASLGSGLHLVGESKQRSAATSVAQERLERAHNVPYSRLALYQAPLHSGDAGNPDSAVSADGTQYTVDSSTQEALVVDVAVGALKHIDDPVALGTTQFNVYQYVTWHDDPAITGTGDYKRIVVVVTWKFPVHSGLSHSVTTSTFVGAGGVVVPTAAPPTATPTPTPAPSANPTPPPMEACGAMTILSGAGAAQGYTNSTTVQVQLTGVASCTPASADLSNNGSTYTQVTATFPSNVTWTIPTGDGPKNVYARFHDSQNNTSTRSGVIALDQTRPPTITNLRPVSCALSGSNRTVSLTWDGNATSDANFLGYRVYRSIELATFSALLTTGAQSATDTTSKSYTSVRYLVRAYDKAGNESGDSNVLSYSKNNC
jgi:hypothetical protein